MRFGWQKIALAVMAAGAAAGAWTAARLLRAEWAAVGGTEVGLRAAAKAVPENAEYWGDLADWERALAANPRSVEALLGLGIQAEVEGRFDAAEGYLLAAARADRGYDPRWALENFYFRRGRWADFWRLAPEACERAYGDPRPLFELFRNSGAGAEEIFEKGVARAGRRAARAYLYYVAGRGEIDAAAAPARMLMKGASKEDEGALRAYGEGLLRAKRGRAALAVFDEMARAGLERGENSGFDWRAREIAGAPVLADAAGGAIRVSFSGGQPASCEPVWRYTAMEPGGRYRLRFRYRTEGIRAGSGLQMTLGEATVDLASDEWAEAQVQMDAGEADLTRAALKYRRARGFTRIEGTVWLRDFRWERVQ